MKRVSPRARRFAAIAFSLLFSVRLFAGDGPREPRAPRERNPLIRLIVQILDQISVPKG